MLNNGRIPLNSTEHEAVDKLISDNPDESVSMTRQDPGDTGPLLAYVGEVTYVIADDGTTEKVS